MQEGFLEYIYFTSVSRGWPVIIPDTILLINASQDLSRRRESTQARFTHVF